MNRHHRASTGWTSTFVRAGWLLAVAVCWSHSFQGHAAERAVSTASSSTNAEDKADCERQLNIIFGAIRQFQKQHGGMLPGKLSDLTPDFLNDEIDLTCPYVRNRGGLRTWRKKFQELSPDAHTSYGYELPPVPMHYNMWRGVPQKTWRDFKLRVMEEVGQGVPMVRCHDHRPRLNLGYDGRIYESELYWEQNFTNDHHALTPPNLFARPAPSRRPGPEDFPPRDTSADVRLIDLTAYYNAALASSWQGYEENHLAGLPAGLHEFGGVRFDVRGVIQLRGIELLVPFPDRVEGIKVRQKCRRIHFLHAASFTYVARTTNAQYTISYADGRVEEMPVIYGRQTSDWWFNPNKPADPTDAKVAWVGESPAARAYGKSIRLYQAAWENPRPDAEIATISFAIGPAIYGPFLVAITLE